MDSTERWTRGTGSGGIGVSGHVKEYSHGVLVSNFVEDIAGAQMQATGKHWLGQGQPMEATSTQRRSYHGMGKSGPELAVTAARHDKELATQGLGSDLLTRHGDFWQPRQTYYASLNQLTYGADRHHQEPRVGTYLWTAGNTHNATVPLNTLNDSSALGCTMSKAQQWADEVAHNQFTTTSRSSQLAAALPAASQPRTQTLHPACDDGQLSGIGRKPVGPHRDECDKTYRRTGLRDKYYTGNLV